MVSPNPRTRSLVVAVLTAILALAGAAAYAAGGPASIQGRVGLPAPTVGPTVPAEPPLGDPTEPPLGDPTEPPLVGCVARIPRPTEPPFVEAVHRFAGETICVKVQVEVVKVDGNWTVRVKKDGIQVSDGGDKPEVQVKFEARNGNKPAAYLVAIKYGDVLRSCEATADDIFFFFANKVPHKKTAAAVIAPTGTYLSAVAEETDKAFAFDDKESFELIAKCKRK